MNNVQLPPGVLPAKPPENIRVIPSGEGIPWGAGRPIKPDPSSAAYKARAEINREQKPGAGRPTIFADADELAHACSEYFAWVDANPWKEEKVQFSNTRGAWAKVNVKKRIPYTQGGLCLYLGIADQTWIAWRIVDKFKHVVAEAEKAIRNNKFNGASAGFFNPTIMARSLGLVDKQEITGANGGPQEVITSTMTAEEAAEAYAKTREGN